MAAKSESKVGLVVALVFFILLSIVLGVFAYYGYDGQEAANAEKKKAKTEATDATEQMKWERHKADLFLDYIGKLPPEGRERLTTDLADGKLGAKSKDKETITKILEDLKKDPGWDDAQKKPKTDYTRENARLNQELQNALTEVQTAKNAEKAANDKVAQRDTALKEARNEYSANLKKQKDKHDKDLTDKDKDLDDLRKLNLSLSKDKAAAAEINEKLREDHAKETKNLKDDIKDLLARAEKLQAKLDTINVTSIQKAIEDNSPKGKIVSLDRTGSTVYISLGSSDNVKPQLTFSIFAAGPGGRLTQDLKGGLEVIKVVDAHLSQAKITDVRDPNRSPIVPGDLLFNPAWNPNLQTRVFIAGVIDLTGDGKDNIAEFMRILTKQGIVIDGYLDLKEKKVVGELRRQTDYLILGSPPEFGTGSFQADNPEVKRKQELIDLMTKLQDEALRKAVPIIGLNKYLITSGIRPPRGTPSTDRPAYAPPPKETPKPPDKGEGKEDKGK